MHLRSLLVLPVLGLVAVLGLASGASAAEPYDFYARNWPSGLHENVHRYHLRQGHEKAERGAYQYAMNEANFILARFPNDPEGLKLAMKIALDWPNNERGAMPYFRKALDRYPQHAETWLIYGVYLHRLGTPAEAVEAYRSAIERDANLADAHYNLGLALLELDEVDAASDAAQRAYDLGHPLPGLRKKLGSAGAR